MKIKRIIALLLTLSLVLLCSCKGRQNDTPATSADGTTAEAKPEFTFTKENYPKMGGSLANLPLGEAVTATVLGITRDEADTMIKFEGSTTDNYKWLLDGTFDILLAYEPSEEAKQCIADSGIELEMIPIGADALVFICSLENEVDSLTLDEIKDIYSGKITDWKDVGGSDSEILAYQRNKDSGSQTLFDKLVNLGDDLATPPQNLIADSMIGLLQAVADYDNSRDALGYTVYYYLTNMETEKLETSKILKLNGVEPSNETIENGSYELVNDFYVVIRKDAADDSPERNLRDWILSEQGTQLIRNENYPIRRGN